jgi:hypothetical protein
VSFEGFVATAAAEGAPGLLRERLQAELERGARADALERGFVFRLVSSAGVFVVLYLFLSILVRDPVPLVDELLVGGLGAAAAWFYLERRSLSAPAFAERIAGLRAALDRAWFRPSLAVDLLEEYLEDASALQPAAFAAWIGRPASEPLDAEAREELASLCAAVEDRLAGEPALKVARGLAEPGADHVRILRRLARSAARKELPLVLAYSRARALAGAAK